MINGETDLKIFVDQHRSISAFVRKEEYVTYELTDDFELLTSKGSCDNIRRGSEKSPRINKVLFNSSDGDIKCKGSPRSAEDSQQDEYLLLASQGTFERDCQRISDTMDSLLKSTDVSIEEQETILQLMDNKELRSIITDVFNGINAPKQLFSNDCLLAIADISKFILTRNSLAFIIFVEFVNEDCIDFRLLYTIMESSQNIFYLVRVLAITTYRVRTARSSWRRSCATTSCGKTPPSGQTASRRSSKSRSQTQH